WCGGRRSVGPLLAALADGDWVVRQGAHVALTNLTGMEFPFNALARAERRRAQAAVWRRWWSSVPPHCPPREVLELLSGATNLALGRSASASTTYKGPPEVLVDGRIGPAYWQTKLVDPPQWCTIDLGRTVEIGRVVVHQYSERFVMTEYEVATSVDGKAFTTLGRRKGKTPVELVIDFPARAARWVRVTSYGSVNPAYPCTFFEIEVHSAHGPRSAVGEPITWRLERGLRALGALGGQGATAAILDVLGETPAVASGYRPAVRAGIRSLGRLREEAGFEYLIRLLDNTMWARYAADALGDFGDRRAVPEILARYPRYAKTLKGENPPDVPADDRMGFPSEDRMLETPYWFQYALCRLPLDDPHDRAALARIAPLLLSNMPGDHDTFILYEAEPGHLLSRYLLEKCGRRQEACEHVFRLLGQPRGVKGGDSHQPGGMPWPVFEPYRVASWLPALCAQEDLPRLVALLEHPDGWVRINAAKALAFLGDPRAIRPLARLLAAAKAEADYGYSGTFKDEEYNDPAPRWREGFLRALGRLGAHEQTDLIVRILNDERSVLEVRRAAADALADLGNRRALDALAEAALAHSFRSVRLVA
ncbi:MAG TPA: hypothetical protein EYP56_08610, partial [Planctomycetaceae bacterium]|nr:hypothetical protein [Planctomycetaceae bacterium]